MKKQPKSNSHCRINMRVINRQTGEQRQLSEAEIAERLQKVLSIPPHKRSRQSLRDSSLE